MYARVIRTQTSPENFERGLAAIKERVVPAVKQLPGFKAGYWTGDRKSGKGTAFVLYESEEGVRAGEAVFERIRPQMEQIGLRFESVENLEVLVTEGATVAV